MRGWAALLFCFIGVAAHAQNYPVYQAGHPSRGHMGLLMNNGLLGDAGSALSGQIQTLGIIPSEVNPLPPFCINDAPISNPGGFHEVCIDADAFGGGGTLTYASLGGALIKPFTLQSANILAMTSGVQQIALTTLPPTSPGDVPVCINPTTGQLFQGSPQAGPVVLTDDDGSHALTDDTGSNFLTTDASTQCGL